MLLNAQSILLWALTCITNLVIIPFVSASNYGMSIGDLIVHDETFLNETEKEISLSGSNKFSTSYQKHPSTVNPTNRKFELANGGTYSKPMSSSSQRIFRATFDDAGDGFNISLPGWLCADLVVGNWEAPNGTKVVNGSIGDVYKELALPTRALNNYTYTRAAALAASINKIFSEIICEPTPKTGRALTYDGWRTQDIEGFWEAFLLGTAGVIGIGITGLRFGIIHEGLTANITLSTQVYILAITGTLEFICVTTMFRLQTNGFIPRSEAMILNGLFTLGEKIMATLQPHWKDTCAAWSTFIEGVKSLSTQALSKVRVLNPSQAESQMSQGPSSIDLISSAQDIETGYVSGSNTQATVGGQCMSGLYTGP
ncbi:MAG: hypothetical protein Q9164_003485 [Protoblastenia rupestris]